MPLGSSYPAEIWAEFFERVASGETLGEAYAAMVAAGRNVPGRRTLFMAVLENEELAKKYRRAREVQAYALIDDAIAEARRRDADMHEGLDGAKPNPTAVARSKLIVDTAFRNAEKVLPREYGSKTALVTEDEEGNVQPLAAIVPPKLRPQVSDDDDTDG